MLEPIPVTVFLFTDIEGSTRLWEQHPEAMREALARHDALVADCVAAHRGRVVKSTGDGVHAVFDDPLDGVQAAVAMQVALADPIAGIELRVRAGLHAGTETERGNDFYGTTVNRAARVMSAAHGGQILVSDAMASLLRDRLPVDLCLRPLGRVRLKDLSDPEAVHQVEHPELRTAFPALRSLESTPNNLPHALTSFLGRENELAEVCERLRTARLVTIFGIGGLGKSRLSLQVAAASLEQFPDGVWFVELAPVSDARLVAQTLATVLGIRDDAGDSPHDAIMKFARDRRLLVVLDNCEHLTQACAELARGMLEAGARVKLLATSRERLGIGGEQTYPLAPLPVPPREPLPPHALQQFASVRLLSARALSARPDFAITPDNAQAVAAICQHLDGIPLALELAAARVRSMSIQRIAERLSDRFKLLSTGDRTALPRQQTLRALIDWSYDLLDDQERALFQILSVFAGGFTLEAAEAVAADDATAIGDVVDVLGQLVDKSLVTHDVHSDRYTMLETVRQYAGEALDASGSRDVATARHFMFYAGLGESARQALTGPDQGRWLQQLDHELENIMVALRWCEHADATATVGLELATALKFFWIKRGLLNLGHRLTRTALERSRAAASDVARCRGLLAAGQIALVMGRYEIATRDLREGLEIARRIQSIPAASALLPTLATAAMGQGDLKAARELLLEALSLADKSGNRRTTLAALHEMAQLERLEHNSQAARKAHHEALDIARELDDRESIAIALLGLSTLDLATNDATRAAALLDEVHSIVGELRSLTLAHAHLEVLAAFAADSELEMHSATLIGAADAIAAATDVRRHPADRFLLDKFGSRGSADSSAQSWRAARLKGRDMTYEQAMGFAAGSLEAIRAKAR